jgi:hypothetical protein
MEVPDISVGKHTIIENPGGLGFRIEKIWAFVSTQADDDNDEGVVAALINGSWMPLIAADEKRLQDLMPLALEMANDTDAAIRLVCFENRRTVMTLGGKK